MTDALQQTTATQHRVANPLLSAWVSANAGTGKTYVLVRRVIRQLLAGAAPQSILCITYTKAAAAEMSSRLLGMLSKWSLLPDEALSQQIDEVIGQRPSPGEQDRARRLFALALESPGGLKIQTIHSFCSSILSRFPAEAGLPLGFRPLEDDQAAAMLQRCVAGVAETFTSDPQLAEHFLRVSTRFQGQDGNAQLGSLSLEQILYDHASQARDLENMDTGDIVQLLSKAVGAEPSDRAETILEACVEGLDQQFLRQFVTVFRTGKPKDQQLAEAMQALVEEPTVENVLANPPIFTTTGTVRKLTSSVRKTIDDFEERWAALAEHLVHYRERWLAVQAFDENISLMITSQAVMRNYGATKDREAALDYEDLIRRTLTLLRNVDASWVRFKLDSGIDHILIDEAQDNSGAQWDIFQQLAEEIVSLEAELADRPRSIFVVGDPKQSIYAFQGAEARLFQRTRATYNEAMGSQLADEELFVSFRTAQPVLDVVDAVFDRDDFKQITGDFRHHASAHSDRPGSVTLWPDLPPAEKVERSAFDKPLDEAPDESIDQRVAQAVARDIQRRLNEGERLACKDGQRLRPQDVLVLFQRRGARFKSFLRALSDAGVPCEGSDRVGLKDEQAVRDLISLLRFAANTDDNLSLAELLRSPFVGWSEDELFDLAAERERSVLWLELKHVAAGADGRAARCAEAQALLQPALDAGARHGPYALLTAVLESGGEVTGRQRLARRLGAGYRQAADAFIDHALCFVVQLLRCVQAFLTHAERLHADVKREL
ncbi:MAG: UvrD-helicase domain-containing protein, partial [Parvularculaceae bacterium]|nr:UvrD-helicase domain-containing protein [Parvularculaceae bacterium]